MNEAAGPVPIQAEALSHASGIAHGFFSRSGGISTGLYRGLNTGLGSNDDRAAVTENRTRVAGWFGASPDRLVTVHQIHSPDVHVANSTNRTERPQADAIVTNEPGLVIGILTADCGPVLFADPEGKVIGAAHAGWKGAYSGVLENTVTAMESLGARRGRITAVLGPSISGRQYEVGPEFHARFVEARADDNRYFSPSSRPGHFLFDLQGLTVDRLREAGINASMTGHCTYVDEDLFFSYRRTTHRGEPDYGRQISAIAIREA